MTNRFIRLDVYAPDDIAKDYLLSANERHMLLTVTRLAVWETQEWTGTFADLVDATGMGKNTPRRVVQSLVNKHLFGVAAPFVRGGQGTLGVAVYDRLVVPTPTRSKRENVNQSRWQFGPITGSSTRVVTKQAPHNHHAITTMSPNGDCAPDEINGSRPSRGPEVTRSEAVKCLKHQITYCLWCAPEEIDSEQKISGAEKDESSVVREMFGTRFNAKEVGRGF
jgi:hypothetical protein